MKSSAEDYEQATLQIVAKGIGITVDAAEAYIAAVERLFTSVDGGDNLLAELSPTKDQACFEAFMALNNTGKRLREVVAKLKQIEPAEQPAAVPVAELKALRVDDAYAELQAIAKLVGYESCWCAKDIWFVERPAKEPGRIEVSTLRETVQELSNLVAKYERAAQEPQSEKAQDGEG